MEKEFHSRSIGEFRRPLWQFWFFKVIMIYSIVEILVGSVLLVKGLSFMAIGFLFSVGIVLLFSSYMYFHVILKDDCMVLKNSLFPFWKRTILYRDLERVQIFSSSRSGTLEYIRQGRAAAQCVIGGVSVADHAKILQLLQEKRVKVGNN